jgi:hypothetical protein
MPDACSRTNDYTILIIGASYAGITAALAILALKDGQKPPLETYISIPNLGKEPQDLNLKVILLDKKDGFCTLTRTARLDQYVIMTDYELLKFTPSAHHSYTLPRTTQAICGDCTPDSLSSDGLMLR